jgi:hypothetical protein
VKRQKAGTTWLWVGGVMLFYFWLIFDVSVPSGIGRIVNLDLMQNRMIGTMFGVFLMGLGAFLKYGAGPVEPAYVPIPPPLPPVQLPCDIKAAAMYAIRHGATPSISRPVWRQLVERHTSLNFYSNSQIEWGYSWDVPPHQFAQMITFIESYRAWEKAQPKGIV